MSKNEELSYKRTVLYGNDFFEIVSCEWSNTSISELHDHGWSQCLILVQEGCFENRAEFGLKTELSIHEPGQVIVTPKGAEHEIKCVSQKGKTFHVYVPKIQTREGDHVFSSGSLSQIRSKLDLNLTSNSTRWKEVELVLNKISELSISTHSSFFMNQLFSGVFPETLVAESLAAQAKTTMATFEASPAFTAVELEVVDRLCELIGWAPHCRDGIGVPGGSAANFMAIHCARQRLFPDSKEFGNRGVNFKVFVSTAAHYSMKKACAALGLGTYAIVLIDTDQSGRMLSHKLREALSLAKSKAEVPLMVCATAGTTVHGAFDPIEELAQICEPEKVWLHVDGAWGGPALFSAQAKHLIKGIEKADSMTFDAHKLFGAGLTCSFFLTRQRGLLLEANDVVGGDYIFHSDEVTEDRGRLSWQCGRGPDALSFWTLWKNLGSEALGGFVDRLFSLRSECVSWIQSQPRLELVANPEYLNICVRVHAPNEMDPDWSKQIREKLKSENFALVNFSKDSHGTFLRLILANPKIKFEHVEQILSRALEVK